MKNQSFDETLIEAIRSGASTREKLMAIDLIRHHTWNVVSERLKALCKQQILISSKQGWRIQNTNK